LPAGSFLCYLPEAPPELVPNPAVFWSPVDLEGTLENVRCVEVSEWDALKWGYRAVRAIEKVRSGRLP